MIDVESVITVTRRQSGARDVWHEALQQFPGDHTVHMRFPDSHPHYPSGYEYFCWSDDEPNIGMDDIRMRCHGAMEGARIRQAMKEQA